MTTTPSTHPYLSYRPKPSNPRHGPGHFFEKLGLGPTHTSEPMRTSLVVDIETHLKSSSHKLLTRAANPEAFKMMVSEFMAEYGPTYWGDTKRDHLQEVNPLKGFLCPRDSQREGSRLVEVVGGFFNYKAHVMNARNARNSTAHRQIRHIDSTAVAERKADLHLIGHPGVIESLNTNKCNAAPSESENEEVENGEFLNGLKRKKKPKRPRPLPDSEESTQQTQTLDDGPTETYGKTDSRKPLIPQLRAISTREFTTLTSSVNIKKDPKRAHHFQVSCREEPSPEIEDFGSFKMPYPHGLPWPSSETEDFGSSKMPYPHGLPWPLTSTPEPNPSSESISILSDDSDTGEEPRRKKQATTLLRTSTEKDEGSITKIARGFEDVKMEPLSDDMMKRTMLLVTVHDSPIGPVPVPFTECGNFHVLFPTLIEERGVPDEDARKIDNITTIFTWTGGEFGGRVGGIRRNKPGDWTYFCDSLRKAHERDSDRFRGKCEVAVKLHINDKHKEHC